LDARHQRHSSIVSVENLKSSDIPLVNKLAINDNQMQSKKMLTAQTSSEQRYISKIFRRTINPDDADNLCKEPDCFETYQPNKLLNLQQAVRKFKEISTLSNSIDSKCRNL
jgi:hypothetical protein